MIIVQLFVSPWLGSAVREKLQEARPPFERIVEFNQGRKLEMRVYTSGTSFKGYGLEKRQKHPTRRNMGAFEKEVNLDIRCH